MPIDVNNRGFLIFSDSKSEWLIPWFMAHFRKHHPSDKICFVNTGVSFEFLDKHIMKQNTYGFNDIIHHDASYDGWFNKPSVCLQTPYDFTIYIDLDCEIKKPIGWNDFTYISDKLNDKIYLSQFIIYQDNGVQKKMNNRVGTSINNYNTGFIVYTKDSFALKEWDEATEKAFLMGEHSIKGYGDQDILSEIIFINKYHTTKLFTFEYKDKDTNFSIFPKYNFTRIAWKKLTDVDKNELSDQIHVIHWTGSKGKNIIKSQMVKMGI